MKKYLAVLGRQPKISLAELESLFANVRPVGPELATFEAASLPDVRRLGGILKIAEPLSGSVMEFLKTLPTEGKLTIGVSDFSRGTSPFKAQHEALKLKRILARQGRSVRVVPNKTAVLSSAVSFHNHLFGKTKIELIKNGRGWFVVRSVQNIEAYVQRDQARPARDAKVGMLPPKLAQVLINLCGPLPAEARVLDPFCGTGVVLQEAMLMKYQPYGTDISERMVEYSERNLKWLTEKSVVKNTTDTEVRGGSRSVVDFTTVEVGDATKFQWTAPIDAVACEGYLGPPMSLAPAEIKLKQAKQDCGSIILGFLKNLAGQIKPETPVAMAIPAWLRPNGEYERLNLLDEIEKLGYNVKRFKNLEQSDLLYHRENQVVAREIIVLRKK